MISVTDASRSAVGSSWSCSSRLIHRLTPDLRKSPSLDDGTQRLRTYAWESACRGFHIPRHGNHIRVAGRMRYRRDRRELLCHSHAVENTEQRMLWARTRLLALLQGILPKDFRSFMVRVFQDSEMAPVFQAPPQPQQSPRLSRWSHRSRRRVARMVFRADCGMIQLTA